MEKGVLVVHMDVGNSFRFPGWLNFYSGACGVVSKSGHVSKEIRNMWARLCWSGILVWSRALVSTPGRRDLGDIGHHWWGLFLRKES